MKKTLWLMAALSLAACDSSSKGDTGASGSDGADGADGGDDGGEVTCDIVATNAAPGDAPAYYKDDIAWSISAADASATVTVTDASGAAVSGTTYADDAGTTIYFDPDDNLTPSTAYTTTISLCDGVGTTSHDFTTSEAGTPIDCDLTGLGYRVNLGEANFVEPAALGGLIGSVLEQDILIAVEAQTDSELAIIGAISESAGSGQDYCEPTIPFPAAAFDNPSVQIGPADTTISAAGTEVTIRNFELGGDFASDCSAFVGGTLSGELDARDLAPLLADVTGSDDPAVACATLEGFGVTCIPCSSDGEPFCVTIIANEIEAGSDASSSVECVPDADCHENCADAGLTTCACD